jgi:hypothetical protein
LNDPSALSTQVAEFLQREGEREEKRRKKSGTKVGQKSGTRRRETKKKQKKEEKNNHLARFRLAGLGCGAHVKTLGAASALHPRRAHFVWIVLAVGQRRRTPVVTATLGTPRTRRPPRRAHMLAEREREKKKEETSQGQKSGTRRRESKKEEKNKYSP